MGAQFAPSTLLELIGHAGGVTLIGDEFILDPQNPPPFLQRAQRRVLLHGNYRCRFINRCRQRKTAAQVESRIRLGRDVGILFVGLVVMNVNSRNHSCRANLVHYAPQVSTSSRVFGSPFKMTGRLGEREIVDLRQSEPSHLGELEVAVDV